jgi:hypothetical protein
MTVLSYLKGLEERFLSGAELFIWCCFLASVSALVLLIAILLVASLPITLPVVGLAWLLGIKAPR